MVQLQHWFGVDRVVLTDEQKSASVLLDIFPKGKDQGRSESYHADGLLWALWVDKPFRKEGVGRYMIEEAEKYAIMYGCKSLALEHDDREAPSWVKRWYERLGYEVKEFGRHSSLLVKQLIKEEDKK